MNELKSILEELRPDIDYDNESELVTSGVFDSFDIVTLVELLEENYQIKILPVDVTQQNFDSIDAMKAMIDRLLKKDSSNAI